MKLKIAICDDDQKQIEYLTESLRQWGREGAHICEISPFTSAEAFLFKYEEDKTFDLLLLDIEMGGIDGVTMARRVRKGNDTVQIVFITGYSEYISEGYEVAALHYLMKPVDETKLFSVLDRAVEKLKKNERFLDISTPGETVRIPLYEIHYLDVTQNYVTIHCKRDIRLKRTLGEFASLLDDRFFKIGRAAIVNLEYINRVTKTDVYLSDGSVLPLPRGAYESLNRAIISKT